MKTVTGLFDRDDQVIAAIDALSAAGVANGHISVMSRRSRNCALEGIAVGALVGGAFSVLAGFGVGAVAGTPGTAGILLAAMAGAAAGGAVGAAIGWLVKRRTDRALAGRVRRGGSIVTVEIEDEQATRARRILDAAGSIDVTTIRRTLQDDLDDWEGFIQPDIWDDDIGKEDFRTRHPRRSAPPSAYHHH